MNVQKRKQIIGYAMLYILFFLLSSYIFNRADDLIFQQGIERYGSLTGWAKWFAENWGGRIIPQGILVLLLQMPAFVFSLFDALAWVILLVCIRKVFDGNKSFTAGFVYIAVPVLLFALLPGSLLQETVFWKCANVLYLWGAAAILVGIYPFVKDMRGERIRTMDYLFSAAAVIYVSGFEQGGVLFCGLALILSAFTLYEKRSIRWQNILLTVAALLLTFCFFILPGNHLRTQYETLLWYPQFDMLSMPEKLLLGIWYVISNIEKEAMFPLLLLAGAATWALHRTRKPKDCILLGAYGMLGYFVLCTVNYVGTNIAGSSIPVFSSIFKLVPIDTMEFRFPIWLTAANIIHFMVYVYLGCCILLINPNRFNAIGFSFYFGGLGSMCMMGFSPTVFASGGRPRFFCYLFMICILFHVLSEIIQSAGGISFLPDNPFIAYNRHGEGCIQKTSDLPGKGENDSFG